jgi:hypothetical protein
VTDLPTAFVTIARDGRWKRIEDYVGAPESLHELEQAIDDAARTVRWIRIDEATLRQRVSEGWSPSAGARGTMLREALEHDELPVVARLLQMGIDPNAPLPGTTLGPLMFVQSAAAARALIDAGASPSGAGDGQPAPLLVAARLAPEVARTLLDAGARADQPFDSAGRTALWHAAGAGNAGVVKVLLEAGGNPAVRPDDITPLECAREGKAMAVRRLRLPRFGEEKPAFVEDFDKTIALLEQALAARRH